MNKGVESSQKTIVLIEPVSCGREYILKAKEMGYRVILFSANRGDRRVQARYLQQVDRLEEVDTNDAAQVIARCQECAAASGVDAVVPGFEYYVPLAARASHALGLPGLKPEDADALRLKHRMRERLVEHGLRAPKFVYVKDERAFLRELEGFAFPLIVKPVDGSGSMNVRRADNAPEALAAFRRIRANEHLDMDLPAAPEVLIEEYLYGPELSVDGYVDGERFEVLSVTEKLLGPEPYFVEAGHLVEGNFNADERAAVIDYTRRLVKAFGLRLGPFHCELRLTPEGPVLIEIAARLPGDQISELIGYAKEIDIYRVALNCYLGLQNPELDTQLKRYAGIQFLMRPGLRSFQSVSGLERFRQADWTRELLLYYQPGETIPEPVDWLGRVGYGIFVGDTYEQLRERLATFDREVQFA